MKLLASVGYSAVGLHWSLIMASPLLCTGASASRPVLLAGLTFVVGVVAVRAYGGRRLLGLARAWWLARRDGVFAWATARPCVAAPAWC